jgi:gluconolactonase
MSAPSVESYHASFFALTGRAAQLERLWTGGQWCEGPVYLPREDAVLWSDIPANRVMWWKDGRGARVWLCPSNFANGHTLDREGRLISCEHGTRRVTRREADGTFVTLASHYRGMRLNSPNDVVVESDGSIWFTDPPYGILSDYEGHKAESEIGANYVFRLDPRTGALAVVADDFDKPNGLAFSPDESVLYISDTGFSHDPNGPHHIRAFDVVDGCRLARGRVFAVVEPGGPDGFCVDCEGNVFTSAWDGIHVYAPDGRLLGKIRVPEKTSNCTFGGPGGNRLFITAETSLYAITLETRGAPAPSKDG